MAVAALIMIMHAAEEAEVEGMVMIGRKAIKVGQGTDSAQAENQQAVDGVIDPVGDPALGDRHEYVTSVLAQEDGA